jgi:hypothetical protein
MNWWSLPGPQSFVDAIIQDVRDGKSVFLSLPEHCPDRLSSSLKNGLKDDFHWLSLTVTADGDPLEFLYEYCAPEADLRKLRSIQTLAEEETFEGHVVWLEDVADADWDAWSRFLTDYERVSRAVPISRRTFFLVPIHGENTLRSLPSGIGISNRRWDGWLMRSDMLLYGASRIPEGGSMLELDLRSALVTTLGAWDPELCEALAPLSLDQLIEPGPFLNEFALFRKWKMQESPPAERAWALGLSQTFHGRRTPHTCITAELIGTAYLRELIWRAEIGVLMPYIEEQRQLILQKHIRLLKTGFSTRFGNWIEDIYDLEIGLIAHQLAARASIPTGELKRITDLKDARNNLSHLEPVTPRILLDICEGARTAESTLSSPDKPTGAS